MQNRRKNSRLTVTLILVLLMAFVATIASASVMAQDDYPGTAHTTDRPGVSGPLPADADYDWTFTVAPRLSFTPNPIGVGQELLVNMWVTPPPTADRFMKEDHLTCSKCGSYCYEPVENMRPQGSDFRWDYQIRCKRCGFRTEPVRTVAMAFNSWDKLGGKADSSST